MKNKHWDAYSTWEEAEQAWDEQAAKFRADQPIKDLKRLPKMPGITSETKKFLRLKGLRYLLTHPEGKKLRSYAWKHPIKYGFNYLKSLFRKKSYLSKNGDFYFYGLESTEDLEQALKDPDALLLLGFSYCHKPLECPSGRFTSACAHDPNHPTCRQCFIGKSLHALPEGKGIPHIIPTSFYIGEKVFEALETHPKRKIYFLITACEMTLEMFGDWGNLAGVTGIGVRLDGRICNTWKAFELSEEGIKPGLTVVLPNTQRRMLEILRGLRL